MRLIPIARVGSPHGIKGWLRVSTLAGDLEIFHNLTEVFIGLSVESTVKHEIADACPEPRGLRVKFVGSDSRETAEKIRGLFIFIPEDELPPLEEGEFYAFQLVGLSVKDENGREMGHITRILPTGSNDVIVVRDEKGNELYFPAIKAAILEIDLKNRLVSVQSSWQT